MRLFVLGSFVQACCWRVARLPKAGETFTASAISIEAGGKGLNVAIGARRLGAAVDIALGVGKDAAASELLNLLLLEGVGVAHVHALADKSGYGAGLIDAAGQNVIAVYPGPNLLIDSQHIAAAQAQIKQADLVYAQFEIAIDAIQTAFSIAKQQQVLTVLNPSPWQLIPQAVLINTDILILNETEACQLLELGELVFDEGMPAVIAQLTQAATMFYAHWQGHCLVITLGEHGSLAIAPTGEAHYCPAFKVTAIDTVGAGDAFAAGFCIALMQQKSLVEALNLGNRCGAIVVSQSGVLAALPTADALIKFDEKSG